MLGTPSYIGVKEPNCVMVVARNKKKVETYPRSAECRWILRVGTSTGRGLSSPIVTARTWRRSSSCVCLSSGLDGVSISEFGFMLFLWDAKSLVILKAPLLPPWSPPWLSRDISIIVVDQRSGEPGRGALVSVLDSAMFKRSWDFARLWRTGHVAFESSTNTLPDSLKASKQS